MAEKFEDIECYAILYMKVTIYTEHFVYVPIQIVEGVYDQENETLEDKFGTVYANRSSLETLLSSDPKVVGNVVTKEQLQELYPELPTEEALSVMFDQSIDYLNIGIVDVGEERIKIFMLNFEEMMGQNKMKQIPLSHADLEKAAAGCRSAVDGEIGYEVGGTFSMDANTLKTLVEMEDTQQVQYVLRELWDFYNTVESYVESEIEKDEDEYEEERVITIEEALPIDKTDSMQVFGFDINHLEMELSKQIVNQDEAIEKVVSAIAMDQFAQRPFDRERILLWGPTGSGKTQIMKSLAALLKRPFVPVPTTQLTSAGYVGADIEDYFRELIREARGDIDLAEQGILFFDELDKKSSETGRNNDVAFKSVLNMLLPVFEDTTYEFPMERRNHTANTVKFRTGRLTIVGSGTFEEIVRKKKLARPIGFGGSIQQDENIELSLEDLEESNFPPELAGRFPIFVRTNQHNEESLKKILTDSTLSPLLAEATKLSNIDVDVTWDEGYIEACAREALKKKTGARALKSLVEKSIGKAKMEAARNLGKYNGIHLIEASLIDPLEPLMLEKDDSFRSLRSVFEGRQKVKNR